LLCPSYSDLQSLHTSLPYSSTYPWTNSISETTATIAAGIHSGIGNVGAGTWFATMQSAAAGGAGAAIVHGVVQGCGVMMAGAGGGLTWAKSKLWFLGNGPAGST
jgi:hypothetical protein